MVIFDAVQTGSKKPRQGVVAVQLSRMRQHSQAAIGLDGTNAIFSWRINDIKITGTTIFEDVLVNIAKEQLTLSALQQIIENMLLVNGAASQFGHLCRRHFVAQLV